MTSPSSSDLKTRSPREKIPLILQRLGRVVERPTHAQRLDPVDSLVLTVLSQNTTDANSGRAYEQLRARFPSWEQVLSARASQVAAAIRSGGLAEIKSRRIKLILRRVLEDHGKLSLDSLRKQSPEEVRSYLLGLPGIGRKTAAVVMLFSLDLPAFPVDTHVLRVSKRLGMLPPKTTLDRAHELFAGWVEPKQMAPLHLGLIRHGREICRARWPRCPECKLLDLCPQVGVTTIDAGGRRKV